MKLEKQELGFTRSFLVTYNNWIFFSLKNENKGISIFISEHTFDIILVIQRV